MLGQHLALLPMEPQIGKALVLSAVLGCVHPMLTITALLGASRPPFVAPIDKLAMADASKREFADGAPSDHLAFLRAYEGWVAARRRAAR